MDIQPPAEDAAAGQVAAAEELPTLAEQVATALADAEAMIKTFQQVKVVYGILWPDAEEVAALDTYIAASTECLQALQAFAAKMAAAPPLDPVALVNSIEGDMPRLKGEVATVIANQAAHAAVIHHLRQRLAALQGVVDDHAALQHLTKRTYTLYQLANNMETASRAFADSIKKGVSGEQ
jgi:hypothetical protein